MNLVNLAIKIIYPDGYVDEIEIDEHLDHIDYYKKIIIKSKRFLELCENCNFDSGIHMHIDRILAAAGAIVFFNWNIKEIINNPSYIQNTLPGFMISLPDSPLTGKQIKILDDCLNGYPEEKLECTKYNSETNDFKPYKYIDLKNEINRFKQNQKSEYLKKALIILYNDGFVDSMDIDEDEDHYYYFERLYDKSLRLKSILTASDFESKLHLSFDAKIIEQNAIIFFNRNIRDICNNEEFLETEIPEFNVFLPFELGSVEQAIVLQNFLELHPAYLTTYYQYDKDLNMNEAESQNAWNLINSINEENKERRN